MIMGNARIYLPIYLLPTYCGSTSICGTERSFLYYRSGLFDLGTCCKTQNHAVVLVGFGHDEQTGRDYWIAQNSWSSKWVGACMIITSSPQTNDLFIIASITSGCSTI